MRRAAYLLALLLAALVLAQPRLTVTTDSPFYEPGSTVTVKVGGDRSGALVMLCRIPRPAALARELQ